MSCLLKILNLIFLEGWINWVNGSRCIIFQRKSLYKLCRRYLCHWCFLKPTHCRESLPREQGPVRGTAHGIPWKSGVLCGVTFCSPELGGHRVQQSRCCMSVFICLYILHPYICVFVYICVCVYKASKDRPGKRLPLYNI